MEPTPSPNILNLPLYTITEFQETEHDYHIHARAKDPPPGCVHCGHPRLDGFGRREQWIKDLPMHGKRVGLCLTTRRYRCKACRKTFYEDLPYIDNRRLMTRRLVTWIGQQAIHRPFAQVADEIGVVEGTVRQIFKEYVIELERMIPFDTPTWMGLDEIHLIRPRAVVTNIQQNTLIDILANRNKETIVRYLQQIPDRERIQIVAMDMWRPYRDAVQTVLPQATIVIDKFHVIKMANAAVERVRKRLRATLTPAQRRSLIHDRFILLKRPADLNAKETLMLSLWIKNYPILEEAYRLKETFWAIYAASTSSQARDRFLTWERTMSPEALVAFSELVTAWHHWESQILAYFDHRVTNGYTESLNNLIRVVDRLGRGYSFEALRAKMLFTEGTFKRIPKRPKLERQRTLQDTLHEMLPAPAIWGNALSAILHSEDSATQEINHGVNMVTLSRLIESGRL